jgi:hypothetical protein
VADVGVDDRFGGVGRARRLRRAEVQDELGQPARRGGADQPSAGGRGGGRDARADGRTRQGRSRQWFELPTEKRHRPKPTSYVFAVGEAGAKKLELKTGGNDDHAPPGQAEAQRRLPENFDAIFIFARYPGPKSPAHMLKLTRERLEKVKSIEIEFGKDGIREPKLGK